MGEPSEEAIEEVEGINLAHSHDGISTEDDSLVDHLRTVHRLDTEPRLSAATQEGLHDRLHSETKAIDS